MLNAAIQTARSFTGRLADDDVKVVGDGLAPLVARGYAHDSRAGYRRAGERAVQRVEVQPRRQVRAIGLLRAIVQESLDLTQATRATIFSTTLVVWLIWPPSW
jgi:hypothetical protein